jgi:hypothetical protein
MACGDFSADDKSEKDSSAQIIEMKHSGVFSPISVPFHLGVSENSVPQNLMVNHFPIKLPRGAYIYLVFTHANFNVAHTTDVVSPCFSHCGDCLCQGFGQTCQQVADGRALCQCAMGACGSDGNCAFFNPFDPFASQSPKAWQIAHDSASRIRMLTTKSQVIEGRTTILGFFRFR